MNRCKKELTRLVLATFGIVFGVSALRANALDFQSDVLPILYHHCFACHSEKQDEPKGGLLLDSAKAIHQSGVVIANDPAKSELFRRVLLTHEDEEVMPPLKGGASPLDEAERETLRRWIEEGADFGGWHHFDHRGRVQPKNAIEKSPEEWTKTIDEWVDRYHRSKGTQLNAPISDETFLRRLYLDVVGRIPSLSETESFMQSPEPGRRSRLISKLLESEGYVSHAFNWKADLLRLVARGIPGQPGWLYDEWVKDSIRSRMPYDEYVRQLVTASGYLWENGAVGFYIRDLGMPLDHLSNMTRVFLGTRIECAQCHDHPLEPVTQKDFYQMAAFTFGVTNLCRPSGYSNDNVKQWPEIKARLAAMPKDEAFQQGVSRTISYLKRLTADTDKTLTYPETYEYDEQLRKQVVRPRTLFGEEADLENGDRRRAFAEWLTSPSNPRFARNIANRLWKRAMGAGLVEPVDSFSALATTDEHSRLLDLLSEAMIQLRFDERAFLSVLLHSRLYQSQSERDMLSPGERFPMRGPLLRRLSAEQIWDSLLTLMVEDLDQRKPLLRYDRSELNPDRLRKLTKMSAEEILERARQEMVYRQRNREYMLRLTEQEQEMAAAKERGDATEVIRLKAAHAEENAHFFSPELQSLQISGVYSAKESDPRWLALPSDYLRASEIHLPLPIGHFLRQFGQSDRREIDAFNRDPNTTHALALMNGELTQSVLSDRSFLRRAIAGRSEQGRNRVQLVYLAILVRSPSDEELSLLGDLSSEVSTLEEDLIWALLNSPEFLFNQ